MLNSIQLAFGYGTPRKALLAALIIEKNLILIDHGESILLGDFPHAEK